MTYRSIVLFLLLLGQIAGCGSVMTRRGFYDPVNAELTAGRDSVAAALMSHAAAKRAEGKDRFMAMVDAGLLCHYAGQTDSSTAWLHRAETAAEDLFTKSVSRAALSALLNDNVLEYPGEEHEVLYTNLIKALNYLAADDFDGAFVEIRRANLKLEQLQRKYGEAFVQLNSPPEGDSTGPRLQAEAPDLKFHNSAFARYLSMHMYAAEGMTDDALIDYGWLQQAFITQPDVYSFTPPQSVVAEKTGAVLSVVAMAGLGPTKEALTLRLRADKELDLVQLLITDTEGKESGYTHFPMPLNQDFYAKISIPRMVERSSLITRIRVLVDGKPAGDAELLEDMYRIADRTFEGRKTLILVKTVLRTITKLIAAQKLKKEADSGGLAGWLKKAAVDAAFDLSENADLRCAQYLPGRVYVADIPVPPGKHDVTIEYLGADGRVIATRYYPSTRIADGRFNLVQSWVMD